MGFVRYLRKFSLGAMLGAIIISCIIVVTGIAYHFQYSEIERNFKINLHSQASAILDFAGVLLESRNAKFFSGESPEIPQIIQNEVLGEFTKVSKGQVFFKEASQDPVDPKNKALPFEDEMIDYFKKNKDSNETHSNVALEGKDYYVLARPILAEEKCKQCHPAWTPGNVIAIEDVRIDLHNYNEDLKYNFFLMMGNQGVTVIVLALIIYFVFKHEIVERIHKLFRLIVMIENGKFTTDEIVKDENMVDGSSKNEIDKLFRHVDHMSKSLRPVITNVITQSKNVVFNASYATNKVIENNNALNLQNKQIDESKAIVEGVISLNVDLSGKLGELLVESDATLKDIKNVRSVVAENTKETDDAQKILQDSITSINELQARSADIYKAVDVITEIADETNLISLNAAIEAARAGEHGRSFSVVAEKIRELAEVSLNNADNIGAIVKTMQSGIKDAVNKSLATQKMFAKLKTSSSNIETSFNSTEVVLSKTVNTLNDFGAGFEKQSKSLEEVNRHLSVVFEQSKKVASNSDEVKFSIENIMDESAKLNSLSQGFEVVLNKRDIDRTVVAPPIKAEIDGRAERIVYVFDRSPSGISFFGSSSVLSDILAGMKVKIVIDDGGKKEVLNVEIVYKKITSIHDTYLVGGRV